MEILKGILPLLVIGLLIYIFITKMERLEKEFGKLLNIVGSLKFKQFQHENQLLEREGVYVPEDSAEYVYKILWSTVSDKQKKLLKEEYKSKCPSHIPMWKFVLYNYELSTNITQKEPFMKMSSAEDLLNNTYEMKAAIKSNSEMADELSDGISKTKDILDAMNFKIKDVEKDIEGDK